MPALSNLQCQGGKADEYECNNIDLLAFVPFSELGCDVLMKEDHDYFPVGDVALNNIWGSTDPVTNREYTIVGCTNGTSFMDVTVPIQPLVIAFLPTHSPNSMRNLWKDIKVTLL